MAYDTTTGRWMQQDPEGYVDEPNLYEADDSNPLTFSDPWGTDPTQPVTTQPSPTQPSPPYQLPPRLGDISGDPNKVVKNDPNGWTIFWSDKDGGDLLAQTRIEFERIPGDRIEAYIRVQTALSPKIKGKPCITAAILAGESKHVDNYEKILKYYPPNKFGSKIWVNNENQLTTTLNSIKAWSEVDAATEAINALNAALKDRQLGKLCKCTETDAEFKNAIQGLENFKKKNEALIKGKHRPTMLN